MKILQIWNYFHLLIKDFLLRSSIFLYKLLFINYYILIISNKNKKSILEFNLLITPFYYTKVIA